MPNLYETLFIVAPEADDERIDAVIGDLRVAVENDGGEVLQARVWERRKLAYQVKGRSEGIYVIMHTDGASTLPAALKQRMKLDESVIRHMVVRLEGQQETDVRAEIEASDHTADADKIAAQRAAAERRHEAEQAAAAMSLEEQVAAEEAEQAPDEGTPDTSEVAAAEPDEADESTEAAPESDAEVDTDEPVGGEAAGDDDDQIAGDDEDADEDKEN